MKLTFIITLYSLIVIVKGAFWAAAVQPIILSLGAILAALDLEVLDAPSHEWKFFPSIKRKKEVYAASSKDDDKKEEDEEVYRDPRRHHPMPEWVDPEGFELTPEERKEEEEF